MIRAVFFDLYQTLVRYDPPREDLISGALGDFGIVGDDEQAGLFTRAREKRETFLAESLKRIR